MSTAGASASWNDGIAAAGQAAFDKAAAAIREAMTFLEEAEIEPDSDMDIRAQEALSELEDILSTVEWSPPAEH